MQKRRSEHFGRNVFQTFFPHPASIYTGISFDWRRTPRPNRSASNLCSIDRSCVLLGSRLPPIFASRSYRSESIHFGPEIWKSYTWYASAINNFKVTFSALNRPGNGRIEYPREI